MKKEVTPKTNELDPEFVAKIVRDYILPMFDGQKEKENKLKSIARPKSSASKFKFKQNGAGPSSIYGELKLSDKLAQELQVVKDHLDFLTENLENVTY